MRAAAAPMPVDAPVMMAVLPTNRLVMAPSYWARPHLSTNPTSRTRLHARLTPYTQLISMRSLVSLDASDTKGVRAEHRRQARVPARARDDAGARRRSRGRALRRRQQAAALRQRRQRRRRAAHRRRVRQPLRDRASAAAGDRAHDRHLGAHQHRQRLRLRRGLREAGARPRSPRRRRDRDLDQRHARRACCARSTRCRKLGIHTIGLTGGDGGKLAGQVDHLLNVSASRETARIQETHILVGHVLCELVDEQLYGGGK